MYNVHFKNMLNTRFRKRVLHKLEKYENVCCENVCCENVCCENVCFTKALKTCVAKTYVASVCSQKGNMKTCVTQMCVTHVFKNRHV